VVADFEARFREALEPFRARFPNVGATTTVFADAPALEPDEDGAAMHLVTTLTGANAPEAVAFAAEAGLYQAAGLSAVVIGPGSIEQAHKADEYVSLEQLAECGRFLNRLVHHLER
jgi:acetylornithine deacetylase